MQIFFRCIPRGTHPKELASFITPYLNSGVFSLFQKPGELIDVRVLSQKDVNLNTIDHHGLVLIEPDLVAERVIRSLRKTPFKGKRIIVREFVQRSWQNDRRCNPQTQIRDHNSRRKADRRQHKLETVTHFGVSFVGLQQFSRKIEY
ncbi:MAG: hypothetical protein ACU826_03745 [Gammaproteobacteria bacterium]